MCRTQINEAKQKFCGTFYESVQDAQWNIMDHFFHTSRNVFHMKLLNLQHIWSTSAPAHLCLLIQFGLFLAWEISCALSYAVDRLNFGTASWCLIFNIPNSSTRWVLNVLCWAEVSGCRGLCGRGFLQGLSSKAHLYCPPPLTDFAQGLLQLQSDQLNYPHIHTADASHSCSRSRSLSLSAHTPLCIPPPPLLSGSVDHTDDSIDYSTSVSEPGERWERRGDRRHGERWIEGQTDRGGEMDIQIDRQIERGVVRETGGAQHSQGCNPSFPLHDRLFITIMSVLFITEPANENLLKPTGRQPQRPCWTASWA